MVEGVVVMIHLVVGDEGGEVILVGDVEDRDGVVSWVWYCGVVVCVVHGLGPH